MFKDAVQTFAAAFAATLVLTGCERAPDPVETDGVIRNMVETAARLSWIEIAGEDGVALSLLGEGDRQLMHMACLDTPARLTVIGRTFQKIDSEDRLTVGLDDEAFALVADLEVEDPGVTASGAIDAAMIRSLGTATEISAVYGGQRAGPFEAPSAPVMARFVETCRTLAAREIAG